MRRLLLPALLSLAFLLAPTQGAPADGRAGVVVDRQGTALVRAAGAERWSPAQPRMLLMPGDQLKTPIRGANAAEVRLAGGGALLIGPGALVEIVNSKNVKLVRGDVEAKNVTLSGPGGFRVAAKEVMVRAHRDKVEPLAAAPRWLSGYRSSTTDEWMGSLVANVDGRDVALGVGYHKVTVDIRDQLARTTVEQSFKNTTKDRLEGVFYFPLPADASISGFGMWIGGELVEADIVEKQRARAIYEQILRERKDPGLLEWSGGNLFKARVFPIEPHSEKRIRIRYTQVLPLEGNTVRYRYALRSELLSRRPVRELKLAVHVSSAMAIAKFGSSTHEGRVRATDHAASFEFDAEEYAPQNDFELTYEVGRGDGLTVIPHRRGDDGYFMVLLAPPDASAGRFKRALLPDAGALDLVIVADTSGSMDPAARAAQSAFIGSLLGYIGKKDRFRLLACDVDATVFSRRGLRAGAGRDEVAQAALAFLDARPSLGWTDLDRAFAAVRKLGIDDGTTVVYVGDGIGTTGDADPVALAARLGKNVGAWHAVATGSTYEAGVLKAIAGSGGAVRTTGDDPAGAAYALLAEAAQPTVKNLKVEFEGVRTARVYPETLPNLPAGKQQVILGRFQPTKGAQTGTVVVTGTLGGKPVRYRAAFSLPAGEEGNSFVPRLWARRHLDALLAQGRSAEIQSQVVSFSEEFGIMTPYTSFLVLESDADRERFGVTRRVKMRDGEEFFAAGRDDAKQKLKRDHMKRARTWRLGLRRAALRDIATLGEHLVHVAVGGVERQQAWGQIGVGGGAEQLREVAKSKRGLDENEEAGADAGDAPDQSPDEEFADDEELEKEEEADAEEPAADKDVAESPRPAARKAAKSPATDALSFSSRDEKKLRRGRGLGWRADHGPLQFGFPNLPGVPGEPGKLDDPAWPADLIALLRALDKRPALRGTEGGLEIVETGGSMHALRGTWQSYVRTAGVFGRPGWFVRSAPRGGEPYDQWTVDNTRGVLAAGRRLGRTRKATPADRQHWYFPFSGVVMQDYVRAYREWRLVGQERNAAGHLVVTLGAPNDGKSSVRWTIDTERRVFVERANLDDDGKVTWAMRSSGFVNVAGLWWATKVETADAENRVIAHHERTVTAIDAKACAVALKARIADHGDAIFLGAKDPTVLEAKQALLDGNATFAHQLRMVQHFSGTRQWDRVFEYWDAAAKLVPGKPGATWLKATLYQQGRRGAELKTLLEKAATSVAASDGDATVYLADYVMQVAQLGTNERLALLDRLRPAYLRDDAEWSRTRYELYRAGLLNQLGRATEALALYKAVYTRRPHDLSAVQSYAGALSQTRDLAAALDVLERAVKADRWLTAERDALYGLWTDYAWQRRDTDLLHRAARLWIDERPVASHAYQRYLASLLFLGREAEADAWVRARLDASLEKHAAPGDERAMLLAAIQFALGQGWNYWTRQIEDEWTLPLRRVARRQMADEKGDLGLAGMIVGNWRYRQTDDYAALLDEMRADLVRPGTIESWPVGRIAFYVDRLAWDRRSVDRALWRQTVDRLAKRHAATEDRTERAQLATLLLRLLDAHGEKDEALMLARARLAEATPDERPMRARELLNRLEGRPWTAAIEDESLRVGAATTGVGLKDGMLRQHAQQTLRRLVESLFAMRTTAALGPVAELETLSRAARKVKEREARLAARLGLADRLATGAPEGWQTAYAVERLGLRARARQPVDGDARELFAAIREDELADRIARERCAYVVAWSATRRKASPKLGDEAVAFLERAAAPEKEDDSYRTDWRAHLVRLLLALDRPDELAKLLAQWISPKDADTRWEVVLGYLRAETGDVQAAADLFEAVAARDELRPAERAVLADWYLVLGADAKREDALLTRYRVTQEWTLAQRLYNEYSKITNTRDGAPSELDPDVLRMLRALLERSSNPGNRLGIAQNLYRAVKDFRLLESLPYGVIGHSPERVYPYLTQCRHMLALVFEEATCDRLFRRLSERIAAAERPLDRRGLILLRALVSRRAAEVLNQPGPHAKRGTEALKQGFETAPWAAGERLHMAQFLASLGRVPDAAFAAEQRRQLDALLAGEPETSPYRLRLATIVAQSMWSYNDREKAVDLLAAELRAAEKRHGAIVQETFNALQALVQWDAALRRFRDAERRLEERRPIAGRFSDALVQRLHRLYIEALGGRGTLSFGSGVALFRGARDRIEAALREAHAASFNAPVGSYCALHMTARDAGIGEAAAALATFADERFDALARQARIDSHQAGQQVAYALYRIRSPGDALAFAVRQIENEPAWFRRLNRNGWAVFAGSLGQWRQQGGARGALEGRLLKIVLRELEADLVSRWGRARVIYWRHNHFWPEKREDFIAVAEQVLARHPDSSSRLLYTASYLRDGLGENKRAVAVLVDADRRGVLRQDGVETLVHWLHADARWKDALPFAVKLHDMRPERLDYRVLLIRNRHRLGQDDQALAFARATRAHWQETKRWNRGAMATLAAIAHECRYDALAVEVYEELIPRHQREARGRGIGDGTLSMYYGQLAVSYQRLGRPRKAVDAASAAIVSWGRNQNGRRAALDALLTVVTGIEDLDGFVEQYDATVLKDGLDAPVLRKAFGRVYLERKKRPERAIVQLLVARDLQSNDEETHRLLVQAYDAAGDPARATEALLAGIAANPFALDAYLDLGRRLARTGHPADAERAWTTLVEITPNEADGHGKLAAVREEQGRYADAMVQWRQVIRIRADEPDGYVGLARAQIGAKDLAGARATLKTVLDREWDRRFDKVVAEARQLLAGLAR